MALLLQVILNSVTKNSKLFGMKLKNIYFGKKKSTKKLNVFPKAHSRQDPVIVKEFTLLRRGLQLFTEKIERIP